MAEGFKWDKAALARLIDSPSGPVGKEVERRTIQVESAAKRLCPVDTGRLRSSITHETGVDGRGHFGRVGTNVEYGIFVELGTRRARKQPYLRPALGAAK